MPSPSRSNLTSPAYAQSSLSHWTTVRPSIRAHSTGTTSDTGRSQITMPPEWMPRCRGKPSSSSASSTTCGGIPSGSGLSASPAQRSIRLLHASCWPGEKPSAFAMSRTAERGR